MCRFQVNLICLPLQELDVILGMDGLSTNHIFIDYNHKRLVFSEKIVLPFMLAQQVSKELREGVQCFVILTYMEKKEGNCKEFIPIVNEFMDVFPKEKPRLPPIREIKFSIDLVLRAGPISITPYRMAPTKLVKLKK